MTTKMICDICGKILSERKETFVIEVNTLVNDTLDDLDYIEPHQHRPRSSCGELRRHTRNLHAT